MEEEPTTKLPILPDPSDELQQKWVKFLRDFELNFQLDREHRMKQVLEQHDLFSLDHLTEKLEGLQRKAGLVPGWKEKCIPPQGTPEELFLLGYLYAAGIIVSPYEEVHKDLLLLSAREDFVPALLILGILYEKGANEEGQITWFPDTTKAIEMFRRAADKDHPMGYLRLGMMYLDGKVKDIDEPPGRGEEKGLAFLQKAADRGAKHALCKLGKFYYNKQMWRQAAEYWGKALWLRSRNRDTKHRMFKMYKNGKKGLVVDQARAEQLLPASLRTLQVQEEEVVDTDYSEDATNTTDLATNHAGSIPGIAERKGDGKGKKRPPLHYLVALGTIVGLMATFLVILITK